VRAGQVHDRCLDAWVRSAEAHDNALVAFEGQLAGLMREPASQRPDRNHGPPEDLSYRVDLRGSHDPSLPDLPY